MIEFPRRLFVGVLARIGMDRVYSIQPARVSIKIIGPGISNLPIPEQARTVEIKTGRGANDFHDMCQRIWRTSTKRCNFEWVVPRSPTNWGYLLHRVQSGVMDVCSPENNAFYILAGDIHGFDSSCLILHRQDADLWNVP